MSNPLNDGSVNGNTIAWLQDLDRADKIMCECSFCGKEVREDQELCDRCKDEEEIDGT
jgi:predicted amidophosphoribosyltransferase